jgi:hypothetical protein
MKYFAAPAAQDYAFPLPFPHSNLHVSVKPIVRRIDPNPNHFLPILKGKHSLPYQLCYDIRQMLFYPRKRRPLLLHIFMV